MINSYLMVLYRDINFNHKYRITFLNTKDYKKKILR